MRLLIRVDADASMGTGHAHRALALAEEWVRRRGRIALATRTMPEGLLRRFTALGATRQGTDVAQAMGDGDRPDWILLDGYHLGPESAAARAHGVPALTVDDDGRTGAAPGVVVVDAGPRADARRYPQTAPADLLLGPAFTPLRSQFRRFADWGRPAAPIAPTILVTLGGNAPVATLEAVVGGACGLKGATVRVVSGSAQQDRARLAEAFGPLGVTWLQDVEDMATQFQWADLVVSGGGTTVWEALFMQTALAVVQLADNQAPNCRFLQDSGLATVLGDGVSITPEAVRDGLQRLATASGERNRRAIAGRRLVDGDGTRRIVERMKARSLRLRPATQDDRDLVLAWSNDRMVRDSSFDPRPIDAATHAAWFARRVGRSPAALRIGVDPYGDEVGLVRFEGDREPTISVNVAPSRRGEGWGLGLIWKGTTTWMDETPACDAVVAFIKPDNAASMRAFAEAGYRDDGVGDHNGQVAHRMVFSREPKA